MRWVERVARAAETLCGHFICSNHNQQQNYNKRLQQTFNDIYIYTKGTVYLRPQIAKANRGGRSYTQSVVKPVIILKATTILDQLNTTMLN